MKFLIVDVDRKEVKIEELDKVRWSDYIISLDCDFPTPITRSIGGRKFGIVIDDLGLSKINPKMSAKSKTDEYDVLYGSIWFTQFDEVGNEIGLTDEEIEHLKSNIVMPRDKNGIKFPLVIMD